MPSTLSDAFLGHPVNLHQNVLDLNSIKELPETHAWGSHLDDDNHDHEPIPIIDLNDEKAIELIGHACKTWGLFQVTNHDISKILLDEIELVGNSLFSLTMHEKLKAARPADGVSGYGAARISSFFRKNMWSEGFTIAGSPVEHARKLWPHDYQKFCETIEDYQNAMNKLAPKLMWLMLASLNVTEEDVKWATPEEGGCAALQLNSYPACPDPGRAMGLAPHTDSTLLTILHQNNTSGLQVTREGGNGWVTVPPHPGGLVVHVGDLMHILSNGLYPSALHRAVVNRTRHRLSVAYLYGPPSNVQISPVPKLVEQCHPRLYRPITWSEYLGIKAKHFDKALASLRLSPTPTNDFVDTNDQNSVQVG